MNGGNRAQTTVSGMEQMCAPLAAAATPAVLALSLSRFKLVATMPLDAPFFRAAACFALNCSVHIASKAVDNRLRAPSQRRHSLSAPESWAGADSSSALV